MLNYIFTTARILLCFFDKRQNPFRQFQYTRLKEPNKVVERTFWLRCHWL